MGNYLECTPSYGRDYKSQKEVKADWEANKDFTIASVGPDCGRQINKQDARKGDTLMIRFKQLRNVCVIAIK